ncbi:MAG: hypothetical protein QXJ68_03125 [Methanocellales archaeon]
MKALEIDREVYEFIKARKRDFRVYAACDGAVTLPVDIKPLKQLDYIINQFKIKILRKIDSSMFYWVKLYDNFSI